MGMTQFSFLIGDKAKKLLTMVLDATTSRNKYPVKFRRLSDRIQECAMDIYCNSMDANGIRADTQWRKECRFDLQTRVVTGCDKLMALVEYSLHAGLLSGATCELWVGLISDIKYMTLSWRSKG